MRRLATDAQNETKEKLLAEEERLKQNENKGVRLPCDSNYANYVVSKREERVGQGKRKAGRRLFLITCQRQFLRSQTGTSDEISISTVRLWSSTLGLRYARRI
jgi:hypothetical protein